MELQVLQEELQASLAMSASMSLTAPTTGSDSTKSFSLKEILSTGILLVFKR